MQKTILDLVIEKKAAADKAIEFIESGMIVGLGTGSTVKFFIESLAEKVRDCFIIKTVSTSNATGAMLESLGIEVVELNAVEKIDVTIDGADEVDSQLNGIKGGGGALTREKVLAGAARRFVCIVDDAKLVGMLGEFPLPIEVLPMAQAFVSRKLLIMRAQPVWREGFVTDNGNHIIDVRDLAIGNPLEMEARLNQIPGIVTVGIFAHRAADVLLIGDDNGVREMRA